MSERIHPRADELDSLSVLELVTLMHEEDARAMMAVDPALPRIADAVDRIGAALTGGGRLLYFGAGTSGRIAHMEAAEIPATFGIASGRVAAQVPPDGEAEDDRELGRVTAEACALTGRDVVIGVSASGSTPYVVGAFEVAAGAGALRVAVVCQLGSPLASLADVAIEMDPGAEVIAGSTRLKAGTAQKVVLNMIGTAVFTRLGHTHRGQMISVVASNAKLRTRAARIVADLGGVSEREAVETLAASGGDVKVAIVMARRHMPADEARRAIERAGGNLDLVIGRVAR